MLTSRMDKLVAQHYALNKALKPVEDKNNVHFETAKLQRIPGFCRSRYKNFFTVPLLFYTYSQEKIICQVNPRIYASVIANEFYRLLGQDSTFRGKILDVNFTELGSTFNHRYEDSFVAISYFSVSVNNEECFYENARIKLSYELKDYGGTVIKRGELEQGINNFRVKRSYYDWRKTFIKNFVSTFDADMKDASLQMAQKLVNEIR